MTTKTSPPIASLSGLGLPQPLLIFLNQLWMRTGGNVDVISDIEDQQTELEIGKRTSHEFIDEIDELKGLLAEQKNHSRNLEQQIHMLIEMIDQSKTRNRTLEQNLTELIERVDSGT